MIVRIRTVGAVCDRPYLVDSQRTGRS